ncbi:MAG: hypothetical protein U0872_09005 [Planctomycetaceae bacterium]
MPTLWFRNDWSWRTGAEKLPASSHRDGADGGRSRWERRYLACAAAGVAVYGK